MTERTGTTGGGSAVAMTECGVGAKQSAVAVGSEQPDVTAYSSNRLDQYSLISNSVSSVPSVVNPFYDLNGQQKRAKPKAKPTGDRDFEAARTRGARSRIRRRSGNRHMTWDGNNAYFWDLQNQLVLVSNALYQVSNAYDAMGRRVRKIVSRRDAETQSWEVEKTCHFFYDGWNLVRETLAIGNQQSAITNLYTCGNDLSGSLQGAGGVGGLLAVTTVNCEPGTSSTYSTYYPFYDHNGNVERYVARNGAVAASFRYDSFANTVSQTFTHSGNNAFTHFRFSTKYCDAETGLYYYGYRFYRPELGRWVNRDPIDEKGGKNLYVFLQNNSIQAIDSLGLKKINNADPGVLIILYLLGRGDLFGHYTDLVWNGIFASDAIIDYKNSLSKAAESRNKCCTAYSFVLPGDKIMQKDTFLSFGSFLRAPFGAMDAAFAIGSGSLSVNDVSVTVICDSKSCKWNAKSKFTVEDIYSFKQIDNYGNMLARYEREGNYHFRMFLNLDLYGKDFHTSDSQSLTVSGKHPCMR